MVETKHAIRFTDEEYLNQREVGKALGTSLIDDIWRDIEEYRTKHQVSLSTQTIGNKHYVLTLTQAIRDKVLLLADKCRTFFNLYNKEKDQSSLKKVTRSLLEPILSSINQIENAQMSELSIRALLNGTYQEDNPFHAKVIAYKDLLEELLKEPIEEDGFTFLAEAYRRLLKQEELTSFFRMKDFDKSAVRNRFVMDASYEYAPYQMVEVLLNPLIQVDLEDKKHSAIIRAVLAAYYLSYIKPFDEFNYELACLLAKKQMAEEGEAAAYLLPFEVFFKNRSALKPLMDETEKSHDLTYFLLAFISSMNEEVEKALTTIRENKILAYKDEYYQPENIKVEPEVKEEPVLEEETKEEEPIDEPLESPSFKEEVLDKEERVEEVRQPIAEAKEVPNVPKIDELSTVPSNFKEERLSEKEVKEYARYLLETNPSLSRNQANFFANHCTVGRYYTIQQFKKECKTAYETARTSMDKLAKEGYYEKRQVKNKFVYTVKSKGDNK